MKLWKLFLVVCFLPCLVCPAAFACRFNVREVGFVDLEDQPYGLFFYVDDSTEKYIINGFTEITNTELQQANIEAITINVNTTSDHPLLQFLDSETKTLPALVLVSPNEQIMKIESIVKGEGYKESLLDALNKIVSSTFRKAIAEKTIDSYGVILIVEGPDAKENKNAATIAQTAINYITSQMEWLPKQVGNPPVILTMSKEQQLEEKILLWSLGIDSENITEPYAVVLYGRGRLMGRPLFGKYLTMENLARFFYVVGADCECSLDRSLMQGINIPARWNDEQTDKLYELLGFDTENPMTKFEISRILRRGSYLSNEIFELGDLVTYLEYEIQLDFSEDEEDTADNIQVKQEVVEQAEIEKEEFKLFNPLYIISAAGLIVAIIGGYFMISASGKKQ